MDSFFGSAFGQPKKKTSKVRLAPEDAKRKKKPISIKQSFDKPSSRKNAMPRRRQKSRYLRRTKSVPSMPKDIMTILTTPLPRKSADDSLVYGSSGYQFPQDFSKEPPGGKSPMLARTNTTSSIRTVKSTLSKADVEEVLGLTAKALVKLFSGMLKGRATVIEPFDEKKHPLFKEIVPKRDQLPNYDDLMRFLRRIFGTTSLSGEIGVIMLIYMDRLIRQTALSLDGRTWKWAVISCVVMATKVWEDLAVWNEDFKDAFPGITTKNMAAAERVLLDLLDFNVVVHQKEYAQYYLSLRQLADMESLRFGLDPLTISDAATLEMVSGVMGTVDIQSQSTTQYTNPNKHPGGKTRFVLS